MITKYSLQNFKSIRQIDVELSRFNLIIGENACGKTNFLESLVFGALANDGKLNADYLKASNVRLSSDRKILPVFPILDAEENIDTEIVKLNYQLDNKDDKTLSIDIEEPTSPYAKWKYSIIDNTPKLNTEIIHFRLYTPSPDVLRCLTTPSLIKPIDAKGNGFYKLLEPFYINKNKAKLQEIEDLMSGLFLGFDGMGKPEQKAANLNAQANKNYHFNGKTLDISLMSDGYVLVLFYLCLFISDQTPKFFAIDNVDKCLNPRLAAKLIDVLQRLSEKYNKQVILTVNNPMSLDGFNILDEQSHSLFVMRLNLKLKTLMEKVDTNKVVQDIPLSESWMSNLLGGLPNHIFINESC